MDIKIPDKWLRKFVTTKATPKEIAKYVSLCGPSISRIEPTKYGPVYSVEVTGNRVDSASVYGFCREAAAILPRFGIKASLKKLPPGKIKSVQKVNYLKAVVEPKLCPRFGAVLIKNVHLKPSPDWMGELLWAVGARPINNIVDISNYIMFETGQPVHTFDYDKIKDHKMILRESRKGEAVITLDGVKRPLPGGDIVIEDGSGQLIDLCGIMGGELSKVDEHTKNVLLFIQTYNPQKIRRTSMLLGHRTDAAVYFEKGLDPEGVLGALDLGISLFAKLTGGQATKEILDLYPTPYKTKVVALENKTIEKKLGVTIPKTDISRYLTSLGFGVNWRGNKLTVSVPSFRVKDIGLPEDIIEEIARLYGYFNIPSHLMSGAIPEEPRNKLFGFETKIRQILKGFAALELYSLSLVSENDVSESALALVNPLAKDAVYLKTSLRPSLVKAVRENSGEKDSFQLFEIANTYLPKKGDLPEERRMLASIFANCSYRDAKGNIEGLLENLNIEANFVPEDAKYFIPSKRLSIRVGAQEIGCFGLLEEANLGYFELTISQLFKYAKDTANYQPVAKFPAQIEDITLTFPEKTRIGEVIQQIKATDKRIDTVELKDIYKNSFTFRIWYQHPEKTLTDEEVEQIRSELKETIKNKFGGMVK